MDMVGAEEADSEKKGTVAVLHGCRKVLASQALRLDAKRKEKSKSRFMNITIQQLKKIIDEQLPAPGSVNFSNAHDKIEIPLFKTIGWLEIGVEGDPGGMESGGHQVINENVGTLVFHKAGKDWELETYSREEIVHAARKGYDVGAYEEREKQHKARKRKG